MTQTIAMLLWGIHKLCRQNFTNIDPHLFRRQVYYISLGSSVGIWSWITPSPLPTYVVYGCSLCLLVLNFMGM